MKPNLKMDMNAAGCIELKKETNYSRLAVFT